MCLPLEGKEIKRAGCQAVLRQSGCTKCSCASEIEGESWRPKTQKMTVGLMEQEGTQSRVEAVLVMNLKVLQELRREVEKLQVEASVCN